nr:collagen alpha-2(I) chain-like isoform X2 [Chrysemys picta bellii]
MPRLEEVANVVLRVPSIVLLDLLYRWDVQAFAELLRPKQEEALWRRRALWHGYYLGHVLCVVVLLLPVRSLVRLYLYGLTLLLLFVGHQTARDYMRLEMEGEFQGAVYQDPVVLSRFVTALTDLCEHALRPPDEDKAGVAVLCPAAPAAGPALRPPPPGASRGQHLRHLCHCGGGAVCGRLPPAGSLPPSRCGVQGGGSGTGDVQAGGLGHVPLEPAGRPGALPCLLAGAVHPPDLLFPGLFQQPPCPAGAALHLPQQRGGVLRHTLLPPRPDLHRLLPRPGRAQPLQVLPAGLRRLPERQRHAQGCDGGRDAAAAGSPDGAAGPADPAENLPPQYHPLHRGDVDPAVHDRDSRPHCAGAGGFAEQEPLEALPQPQPVPLPAGFPLLHGVQDRSLLPHGLLAADPGLQLHAHLPAGDGHPLCLRALHDRAAPGRAPGEDGRDHLLRQRGEPGAGVPGGRLRGGLRHLGVRLRRVELDGRLRHHHPLLLQRVAAGPVGLEELPAPQGGRQEDQLAAQGHQGAAAGPQRRVCHLLPGDERGRDHRLWPLLPHGLSPQVAVRAGHLPHVPPAGEALGHRGAAARRGRAGGARAHPRGATA